MYKQVGKNENPGIGILLVIWLQFPPDDPHSDLFVKVLKTAETLWNRAGFKSSAMSGRWSWTELTPNNTYSTYDLFNTQEAAVVSRCDDVQAA